MTIISEPEPAALLDGLDWLPIRPCCEVSIGKVSCFQHLYAENTGCR